MLHIKNICDTIIQVMDALRFFHHNKEFNYEQKIYTYIYYTCFIALSEASTSITSYFGSIKARHNEKLSFPRYFSQTEQQQFVWHIGSIEILQHV